MDKEEEKNGNRETSIAENNEHQEKVEESTPNEEEAQKADPAQKKKLSFDRTVQFLSNHKWSFLFALGSFFILIVLGITIGPKWLNNQGEKHPGIKPDGFFQDNLQEEGLSPFFIPLPPGSPKRLVMIDFSVIWDGLASVRFNKVELRIRDYLYRYIVELAERSEDLQEKTALLETEMSRIFRERLGMENLEIKIKEINYL